MENPAWPVQRLFFSSPLAPRLPPDFIAASNPQQARRVNRAFRKVKAWRCKIREASFEDSRARARTVNGRQDSCAPGEKNMTEAKQPEPWLRGTLAEVPAVGRAVLHALEAAQEDLVKWCGAFDKRQLNARPNGAASVAFHIRHVARSIDRLLTYAEGRPLDEKQIAVFRTELDPEADPVELFQELQMAMARAGMRIRILAGSDLETPRRVGRKALPTSLGGLLVHVADHTQRHVGQAIATAKFVLGSPADSTGSG